MRQAILGGIGEEGNLIDRFFVLLDDLGNLNELGVTLPGHQGCGSTFAHTISRTL